MNISDFTFEVVVNDRPVTEYPFQNDVYIEGRKGSEFQLRFSNKSNFRVLVVPSVDGLSTLDGKTASLESPGIIVDPNSTITIPGWAVNLQKASSFVFEDRQRSYARGVDPTTTNTGVIGMLVFAEEYTKQVIYASKPNGFYDFSNPNTSASPSANPYVSPVVWSSSGVSAVKSMVGSTSTTRRITTNTSGDDLGVGWGKSVDFNLADEQFNKGSLLSTFVLFYDSRKNLERRGIIVDRYALNTRPNPFPGIGCTPPKGWQG